jgi:hypothetical protein
MCTAIYIASELALPTVDWREDAPSFYVSPLPPEAEVVRQYFAGPHVYSVGSYQGCGCGLAYQPYPGGDDEEAELSRRDWSLFARYLDQALERVPVVELFTCVEGDQHEPPDTRLKITPSDIRDGRFDYEEGTHASIERRS